MGRIRCLLRCLVEPLEGRQLLSAIYPTNLEQYMVELINHARSNPTAAAALYHIDLNEGLAPGTISADPKQPLAINPFLDSSALSHTQDMLQTQVFAHTGSDGSSPYDREIAAGYVFAGSWGWGENIAYISNSAIVPPPQATASAEEENLFVDSTEAGRGHRLNLLDPAFKEIGVGTEEDQFDGMNTLMTTEDFAYTGGNSFLTGVVYNDSSGNGLYDPGEGLAGATITAVPQSGGTLGTTVSWSTGGYTLQLAPGTYTVTASGGPMTTPIVYKNVTIGTSNVEVDFNTAVRPVAPTTTPTGTSTPTPTPTSDPSPTPTPTTGSGSAAPSNPAASGGSGSTTSPSAPGTQHVGRSVGTIEGRVEQDLNDNSRLDPGEIGAPYVTVFLDTQGTTTPTPGEPTSTTNADGEFQFIGVAPGKYKVVVVVPSGWRISTASSDSHPVRVQKGHSVATAATFFITPTALVSGTLINDGLSAGSRTVANVGISGWTVLLQSTDANGVQRVDRASTTRHKGAWSFGDIAAGTYTVTVVLHKNYILATEPLVVGPLSDGDVSQDNLIGVHRV